MIEKRKNEHIEICLGKDTKAHHNYWDEIDLVHRALPEVDFDDIDLSTELFGVELKAPIIISAMTGGTELGKRINENLAIAAEKLGIGMGVGSQRPYLVDRSLGETYSIVKEHRVPLLLGNIGAPQLIDQKRNPGLTRKQLEKLMIMLDADILAVHLNFLQEAVQPEGDMRAEGILSAINSLSKSFPVIVKETGAGISRGMALKLKRAGVMGIDVGGMGGTSFAAVEKYRAEARGDRRKAELGDIFWDWGIPTPASVLEASVGIPVIATGGIRNGLDAAKALALGASAVGIAGELLKPATESPEAVIEKLEGIIHQLKVAMFLVGARNVYTMKNTRVIVHGRLRDWFEQVEV